MSDPVSVVAAYSIVLGGLALYVASIARRVRATRRIARAVENQRDRDRGKRGVAAGPATAEPAETGR